MAERTSAAAVVAIRRRASTDPSLAGRATPGCRSVVRVPSARATSAILAADRRAGDALRARARAVPGGHEYARLAADAMAPGFQALVVALLVLPGSRALGLRAAIAAVAAGAAAKAARDAIDRPRPGTRADGGLPSRHAASATAIALVISRERPVLGAVAQMAAIAGFAARVAAADHDPLDVVAGAGVGATVARVMRRRRPAGTRR